MDPPRSSGLHDSVRRQLRRSLLREASVSAGPLVAIATGFALVPVRGPVGRSVVLAVVLLVTAAAAAVGGARAGATTALAAALVMDFSHTAPYDLLTLTSFWRSLALFEVVGVAVGLECRRARPAIDDGRLSCGDWRGRCRGCRRWRRRQAGARMRPWRSGAG